MEKYLKIGERYVQWVALALGVGWLALMAYLYLLQPPLTVELERNRPLEPGQVDLEMQKGPLSGLSKTISDNTNKLTWGSLNPVAELQTNIAGTPPKVVPVNDGEGPRDKVATTGQSPATRPTLVEVPAPEVSPADPSVGTSVLSLPQPGGAAPAAGAAGAAANAGGAAGAAAPADAPVQPVLSPQDKDWDSLAWVIKMDDMRKAFDAARIPAERAKVLFLRVQLSRQELSPSGRPVGSAVVIPPQSLNGEDYLAWPDENASRDDKWKYILWAADHQQQILQPAFPGVTLGTPYYTPGDPKPQDSFAAPAAPVAPAVAPVAPALPGPALRGRPLPGVGGRAPAGEGVPYPSGPGYEHAGARPTSPLPMRAPAAPAASPATLPPMGSPVSPSRPPELGLPQAAGGAGGEGADFPGADISQVTDLTVLTHDWTVQGGKTYQYSMRYWIANPLYLSQLAGGNVVDKWSIASPPSPWTKPVEVPSRFKYFVQKFQKNPNNEVYFDVFTKKPDAPGGLTKESLRLTPGDPIGNSGAILVDVRPDPKSKQQGYYFLITDSSGRVERRDLDADKNSEEHQQLNDRLGGTAGAAP